MIRICYLVHVSLLNQACYTFEKPLFDHVYLPLYVLRRDTQKFCFFGNTAADSDVAVSQCFLTVRESAIKSCGVIEKGASLPHNSAPLFSC